MEPIRVGVDLAKSVFQVHGVDQSEKPRRPVLGERVHIDWPLLSIVQSERPDRSTFG